MSENMQPEVMEMLSSPEVKEIYEYAVIGRLEDLGLGSEGGIKSSLETDDQVHEFARNYVKCLAAESADPNLVECVDGRRGQGFKDGSPYLPLDRTAGATFADYVTAKAAHADVARRTESTNPLDESDEIENKLALTKGKCSHGKGCGACNRAVDHANTAATIPAQAAAKALIDLPQIAAVTGVEYDLNLAENSSEGFSTLAKELSDAGWDGNAYTARAEKTNPAGVEDLAGEASQPHHGHKENAIVIIADESAVPDERLMDEIGLPDAFAVTVGRLTRVAEKLAGQRGVPGKTEAVITGLAWNVAVGSNLSDKNMPIIVVWKKAT